MCRFGLFKLPSRLFIATCLLYRRLGYSTPSLALGYFARMSYKIYFFIHTIGVSVLTSLFITFNFGTNNTFFIHISSHLHRATLCIYICFLGQYILMRRPFALNQKTKRNQKMATRIRTIAMPLEHQRGT